MPKAFVVGHPIQHSRSPLIHTYWIRQFGLNGSYERLDVMPQDFSEFIRTFAAQGFCGGNVTVPHKEMAFQLADRTTPTAQKLKAANTLWLENGLIHADNTDVEGFASGLDEAFGRGWDNSDQALVLGAGGAARAVVLACLNRGIQNVVVCNRTLERAKSLENIAPDHVKGVSWNDIQNHLPQTGLLINTTSLGMKDGLPLDIDLAPLPSSAKVSDIVYVPLETNLLKQARARGLQAADGLHMLLHQAVPGFERWFGVRPQVTSELRDIVVQDTIA